MSKSSQALGEQLAEAVAPRLGGETAPDRAPKAVRKTLRKLAKQLTEANAKQVVAAHEATVPGPKAVRQAKADGLYVALQPYLGPAAEKAGGPPKKVAKAVKQLAAQLVKQARKRSKQAAKAARKAVPEPMTAPVPTPTALVGRRPPAVKRPVAKKAGASAAQPGK